MSNYHVGKMIIQENFKAVIASALVCGSHQEATASGLNQEVEDSPLITHPYWDVRRINHIRVKNKVGIRGCGTDFENESQPGSMPSLHSNQQMSSHLVS